MGRPAVYSREECEFRWVAIAARCYTLPANELCRARQQREIHAAIDNRIGRDAGLLGRRQHDPGGHGDCVRRAVDHRRRAQGHRRRGRRRALGSGLCHRPDVDRLRRRRHPHGPHCRAGRRALDGDVRRRNDRARLGAVDLGSVVAALYRPRPVHRPDRHRRHQRSLLRLCQPLVRSPARFGAGFDFKRRLSRRRDLAADIRPRDRICRLAAYHAVLRRLRARRSSRRPRRYFWSSRRIRRITFCMRTEEANQSR